MPSIAKPMQLDIWQSSLSRNSTSGAAFSRCGRYRYKLWRQWSADPGVLFLLLNPSTADAVSNDATIERCERRARTMGFGALLVANLFAHRSTDPGALYVVDDPVGQDNDRAILELANAASMVVCGWGKHGALHRRGEAVLQMLVQAGHEPYMLQLNKDGTPKHPLYVSYAVQPRPWIAGTPEATSSRGGPQ